MKVDIYYKSWKESYGIFSKALCTKWVARGVFNGFEVTTMPCCTKKESRDRIIRYCRAAKDCYSKFERETINI